MVGDFQVEWHSWNKCRIGTEVGEEPPCEPNERVRSSFGRPWHFNDEF